MADMPISILPVRPGTLSADDKAALRESGVVVIEHENPAELQMLVPVSSDLPRGPVLDAALTSLALYATTTSGGTVDRADVMRSNFVTALVKIARESRRG